MASLVCVHNAWLIGNTQERLAGDFVCFHDIMMLTRNSENSPNDSSLNECTQGWGLGEDTFDLKLQDWQNFGSYGDWVRTLQFSWAVFSLPPSPPLTFSLSLSLCSLPFSPYFTFPLPLCFLIPRNKDGSSSPLKSRPYYIQVSGKPMVQLKNEQTNIYFNIFLIFTLYDNWKDLNKVKMNKCT